MRKIADASFVMLSLFENPLSLASVRSGAEGAAGGSVTSVARPALLLSETGSATSEGTTTPPTSSIVPSAVVDTCKLMVTLSPEARVSKLHEAATHVAPRASELTDDTIPGPLSETMPALKLVAGSGPRFVTISVYVGVSPSATLSGPVRLAERSAGS